MKYIIALITVLILSGSQRALSQCPFITGKCIGFETNDELPGVCMEFRAHSGKMYSDCSDENGFFELTIGEESGDLIIRFLGCYAIKILNIPQGLTQIDFGEIPMVENYGRPQFYMDGSAAKLSEEQIAKDKKMRKDVLENYRIKVLGEKLKPYFEGKYIVFDFRAGK